MKEIDKQVKNEILSMKLEKRIQDIIQKNLGGDNPVLRDLIMLRQKVLDMTKDDVQDMNVILLEFGDTENNLLEVSCKDRNFQFKKGSLLNKIRKEIRDVTEFEKWAKEQRQKSGTGGLVFD